MADDSKKFDPDATVTQPAAGVGASTEPDPEATVTQPMPALAAVDPDATVSQPMPAISGDDPEATFTGPLARIAAAAAAEVADPNFDPEATDRRPAFDPEATVRSPKSAKPARNNPFAPKAPPETLQANLSSLGGLNPLIAMANPVLAAVPQIRRTLRHPDPAGLLASLREQLEGLEMSAVSAEIPDDTVSAAVYALCALLDESAASTPWGHDWVSAGLLQAMRGQSDGAEGFFAQLEAAETAPEANADLIEFYYICLALGFEGRHRGSEGGRQALEQLRNRLYATVAKRHPRPEGLSERWRTPSAQAAADAALATAARATAARAAAEAAAKTSGSIAAQPEGFSLSRLPRRVVWSAVAGIVGASIVLYMLSLRLLDDQTRSALATKPSYRAAAVATTTADPAAPAAQGAADAPDAPAAALAKALSGTPVEIAADGGNVKITPRLDRQFALGGDQPSAELRALLRKLGPALDRVPGAVVVVGHADASPAGTHYSSNNDLSLARARAAAQALRLTDAKRASAEGRADAEPIAPNDTDANRAKNRRVVFLLKPAP